MLAAYGTAAPDEAGTYFLAHTFDGRRAPGIEACAWRPTPGRAHLHAPLAPEQGGH